MIRLRVEHKMRDYDVKELYKQYKTTGKIVETICNTTLSKSQVQRVVEIAETLITESESKNNVTQSNEKMDVAPFPATSNQTEKKEDFIIQGSILDQIDRRYHDFDLSVPDTPIQVVTYDDNDEIFLQSERHVESNMEYLKSLQEVLSQKFLNHLD